MTLEEALIDLGDRPLIKSPYSKTILAVVNATVGHKNAVITLDSPGHSILGTVYQIADTAKQEKLLAKPLGVVRGTDRYRNFVLAFSTVIACIAILLATAEVIHDTPLSDGSSEVLREIVRGLFDLIKILIVPQVA
jgi:hypothetical protein